MSADFVASLQAAWKAGDFPQVLALAAANPALLQNDEAALRVALARIYGGHPAAAEPILKAIVARNPAMLDAKAALAKLYLVHQRPEAEEVFRALEQDAQRDPRAGRLLADVYLQARRVADAHRALLAYQRATGDPAADVGLAETFLRMGREKEGVAAARRALGAMGFHASLLPVLGPAALCAGDTALYAQCVHAISAIPKPQAAALLQMWIDILVAGDRLTEAVVATAKLVEIAPSSGRLRALADLYLSNLDVAAAETALAQARTLDPRDVGVMALQARCKIVSGDIDAAKALAQEAIAADPNNVAGYDYLTQIDPRAVDEPARAHLTALSRRGAAPDPRVALSLARLAETDGDYSAAFDFFASAKAEIARLAVLSGRAYDPAATDAGVSRLKAGFPTPIAFAGADRTAPTPIFIVGMPRSGTTLTEQVLAGHPDLCAAGELPAMMRIVTRMLNELGADPRASPLIERAGRDWIAEYRLGLPGAAREKQRVTDKHPLNFMSVGLIKALFPEARIVHVSRDPADTALSIFKERFYAGYAFANDLDALAHYYAGYENLMAHWRRLYGDDIFEVRYEDFVTHLEPNARALVAFCGLPWAESCLNFHASTRAVFTHSAAQVRKPVSTASVSRARKFGDKLKPFEEALARYRAQP